MSRPLGDRGICQQGSHPWSFISSTDFVLRISAIDLRVEVPFSCSSVQYIVERPRKGGQESRGSSGCTCPAVGEPFAWREDRRTGVMPNSLPRTLWRQRKYSVSNWLRLRVGNIRYVLAVGTPRQTRRRLMRAVFASARERKHFVGRKGWRHRR